MSDQITWRILFVDDEEMQCEQVSEYLNVESVTETGGRAQVVTQTDFRAALGLLEERHFDIAILDVRVGSRDVTRTEEDGETLLEIIRQRRFLPIIFYTALPNKVEHLKSPIVGLVEKTAGVSGLLQAVKDVLATGLPAVNRALLRLFEDEQRKYMWEFVAQHWEQFGDSSDKTSVAYLLARRFASSISSSGIEQLAKELGDESGWSCDPHKVPPIRYYILPPLEKSKPGTGDIYRGIHGSADDYHIVLTPACDIAQDKADMISLAQCLPLDEMNELKAWKAGGCSVTGNKEKYNQLCALLSDRSRDRLFCLPGVFALPNLVVDLQRVITLPPDNLLGKTPVATLDSPFAEALQARYSRYCGRIGTPDLDYQSIIDWYKSQAGEQKQG